MLLNVFRDLFIYIKFLLSGDNIGIIKLKELKRLYKIFKPSKYRYITKDKKITNYFFQKMYLLYTAINDFSSILETTLFNRDEKRAQLYLNHFVESNLPEDIRVKREKFTKEMIWKKIMEAENATKTIKSIEDEFVLYKNFLTRQNMPKLESEYYLLYKLNSLATFNFELFFSKFDSNYVGTSHPNFTPINGDEILNDLKDLYFLISSLPIKVDLTSAFNKLYGHRQEDNRVMAKKTQQSINTIYKMISDEFSPQIILALCRYISEDFKLRINVEQKALSILDKYRKEIGNRFQKNKDFVLEKYSEKSLQHDIHSLFEGKHLMKIDGFTDDIMNFLEENNFDPISGIQAIRITKTFILEIYEVNIKEVMNVLILEAFFNEKEYQTDFSNKFFAANELKDYVLGFEENLASSGKNSFTFLKTLLKNFRTTTTTSENKILRQIELVNDKIRHCNEKCSKTLYNLAANIYNIIRDYKSQKPGFISNIKTIKGTQNKEFINRLASSYNDIAKYIKIIKNFVAVDSSTHKS